MTDRDNFERTHMSTGDGTTVRPSVSLYMPEGEDGREPVFPGESQLRVAQEDAGRRLDAWLASAEEGLSRNYAETLILEGRVLLNGVPAPAKKVKVKAGDEVLIRYPEPRLPDAVPEDIPLDIVYEDADVIVVNKPRGMVVHPAAGNETGTLVNALLWHLGDNLSTINGVARPGIVHRIDKDTSGLLMIAKNDAAHESLAEQLRVHSVTREYQALCFDNIKEEEITIEAPIGRDERNRLRRAVNGSNPKEAVTHIRVLERFGRYTLVSARLETGRTHQIRVHLAWRHHPLVGDRLYGPDRQPFGLDGQLLHAKTLGFIHPSSGEYMEFTSELPELFSEILRKLRAAGQS